MVAIVTPKTRIYNANNFIEAYSERSFDIAYMFIGRELPWDDDNNPDTPIGSVSDELESYSDMLAAKKVLSANIVPVIKRFDWETGTIYDPYDNNEGDIINRDNPLYVLTDLGDVYKCLDRPENITTGEGLPSTEKPSGTSLSPITTSDGYVWKYMLTLSIADTQNFLTVDWIPASTLIVDNGSVQWDVQQSAIDGAIHRIEVTEKGSGYTAATVTITSSTGTSATATANVSAGLVQSITVNDIGIDYRDATITITGDGVGATARAVISPYGGHGSDPREELNSIYVMVRSEFIEDENGDFPIDRSYRRIGLLVNPRLDAEIGTEFILTGIGAADFQSGDTITGLSSSATAEVVKWSNSTNSLIVKNVVGVFSNGEQIENQNNLTAIITLINTNVNLPATELTYAASEILNGSGEIIYLENRKPTTRNPSQTEDVKLVIEF